MTINISEKNIKNATVLCGFQSTSVVGPITIQYLLDHMSFKEIGQAWFDAMVPFGLVLKGELVKPMSIFYNKKYNLVLVRTTIPSHGIEWQLAETIEEIAKTVKAKEVVCIDGVESAPNMKSIVYLSNTKGNDGIQKCGAGPIVNAALVGVHSALLIKDTIPVSCFYGALEHAQGSTPLPGVSDSKSAANVISFLDKYLNMSVDVKDLLQKSQAIEEQVKQVASHASIKSSVQTEPKYIG